MRYTVSAQNIPELRLQEEDPVDSVLQNIAVILSTAKGSVPFYREFGLSWEALDKPLPIAKLLLQAHVREAIESWEPRAEVLDVRVDADEEDPGVLLPTVEVEIHG